MWAAKCRRPCLYTRSKSARRSRRARRGNLTRLPEPDRLVLPFGAMALTSTLQTQLYGLPPTPEQGENYSRKPGFTETRLRPFARRREITARPLLVFMRVRNPCVFERCRRLGWNVRLGMKN